MIFDTLSESERYASLHPLFQKAFDYAAGPLQKLAPGRYPIQGDDLYVMVSEGALRAREDAFPEAHDRYIDLQVVLRGRETYGWISRKRCFTPQGQFDRENDIIFFDDAPSTYVSLDTGEFALFFPEDAHAPLIGSGDVKKAVFKIKAR